MKITQKTKLLRVVGILLLFFSTSGAQAEKIKLLCNKPNGFDSILSRELLDGFIFERNLARIVGIKTRDAS